MIYFDSPRLTIQWDSAVACVHVTWRGFVEGEEFRGGLDKGLTLMQEKGTGKWVGDLRAIRVQTQEDQEWLTSEWFPRAAACGLRHMALVVPESVVAKMSVTSVTNRISVVKPIYFDDLEKAKQWLRACV